MESKKLCYLFIAVGIAITLYLNYLILKPFLNPILLAIIFSIVFHPAYIKLLKRTKGRKALASLGACLLVTIIIIVPLAFLAESIVNELMSLYERFDMAIQSGVYKDIFPFLDDKMLQNLYKKVNRHLEVFQIDLKQAAINTLKENSAYSLSIMTEAIKDMAMFIINLLLMLFTMYYLFKDSEIIASEIKELIPLSESQKERIFERLKDIIYATIYGTLVTATVQGFLGGLAFWALGISSPVIWGVVMGLLAVLPMFGAFLIWFPASVILLLQGNYANGIFLLLWGSLVISLIDNLLWPLLVSGRAMLHPLATFFGFLGGIIVFGPIGLFVAPFLMAILVVLLDIIKESGEVECPS